MPIFRGAWDTPKHGVGAKSLHYLLVCIPPTSLSQSISALHRCTPRVPLRVKVDKLLRPRIHQMFRSQFAECSGYCDKSCFTPQVPTISQVATMFQICFHSFEQHLGVDLLCPPQLTDGPNTLIAHRPSKPWCMVFDSMKSFQFLRKATSPRVLI